MRKLSAVIFAVVLCASLVGCARAENIELPFELSEAENAGMFHPIEPMDAEKKVITEQEDIKDICKLLESISLEDKGTGPVAGAMPEESDKAQQQCAVGLDFNAGGSAASFRFNLSDGTAYEIVYSPLAVKSGRIMLSNHKKDYFTSAGMEAIWNDCDYEAEAAENELPADSPAEENTENEVIEFHGQFFNTSVLSKGTLEWLEWYDSLSPEEQLAISSVPAGLSTGDGAGTADSDAEE